MIHSLGRVSTPAHILRPEEDVRLSGCCMTLCLPLRQSLFIEPESRVPTSKPGILLLHPPQRWGLVLYVDVRGLNSGLRVCLHSKGSYPRKVEA